MGLEISPSPVVSGFGAAAADELPLLSLNHVSYVCKSVSESIKFYQDVLGFVLIKRPSSFDFEGAWLFNHGIGIHLLEVEDVPTKKGKINPKDCHISFQTTNMDLLKRKLEEMDIEHVTAVVSDKGITVDQVFFHDPDGYMIEICNCQNLPVIPISAGCPIKTSSPLTRSQTDPSSYLGNRSSEVMSACAAEVASLMMENLVLNMMNFSI